MEEDQSIFLSEIQGKCEICKEKQANYRCPKCGLIYCSIECYKKHNDNCVAKFSNDLLKQYKAPKVSNESRIQMQKILEQNEKNQLFSEDDHRIPIQTEVEPWNAWWVKRVITNYPQPKTKPPSHASELLVYHLVDILYSYCYTLRLYNGDVSFDFEGACSVMISISSILNTTEQISSVKFALNQCINNSKRPDIFVEYQWQIEVIHDVELCLQTKAHIFRALSEAHAIAKESKLKLVYKKLEFFFSWAQTLEKKQIEDLQYEVHDYYTSMQALYFDIHE